MCEKPSPLSVGDVQIVFAKDKYSDDKEIKITILDKEGRVCLVQTAASNIRTTLDVSGLATGIYLIVIQHGLQTEQLKFQRQ